MHGFYSSFVNSVEKYPAHIAAELQRPSGELQSHTYAELRNMAESVGRWLSASGMSGGVRCAIMAGNGPLWVAAYLGVLSAGAVAVPLDTAFNANQVNKLLWDSGAAVIFTDAKHLALVETAVQETLVRVVMVDGSGEGKYSNLLGMFAAPHGTFPRRKFLQCTAKVYGRRPLASLGAPGNRPIECEIHLEDTRPVAVAPQLMAICGG